VGRACELKFLVCVSIVEVLMRELVRQNVANGSNIPVVKIMMLCKSEL
jgi:hypothetical protein